MNKQFLRVFLILSTLASLLVAQTMVTGEIAGSLTDPSGAAVGNGKVVLKSVATGESQTATTTTAGEFHFSLLRPGAYTLTVTAAGFEETTQQATVNLGANHGSQDPARTAEAEPDRHRK